uniref:Craniofacial development protein 2 n=1 Tax=Cacopsylla melanoneura TaxID=428564 RepID=A0A8D8SH15_9HEMI
MAMLSTKSNSGVSSPPVGSPGRTVMSQPRGERLKCRSKLKICTWNVKTMSKEGKIENAIQEMKRMHIEIMGISEMRWPNSGEMQVENHKIYYSGKNDGVHEYGVGVIVSPTVAKCVTNFTPVSERIMLLQIQASPINISILQVYAPTADKEEEEVVELYQEINKIIEKIPKHEILIVMGDFNAKIGAVNRTQYIGAHGLGNRNDRGDLLEKFAESSDLVVMNTFFELPPRKLYTWKSPQDKPERIVRNQIDYILVNRRFRNSCKSVRTYPGADLESDHVPLVGVFQTNLKKVKKRILVKHDMRRLRDPSIMGDVFQDVNKEIQKNKEEVDIEQKVNHIKESVQKVKEKYLKPDKRKKKSWMTEEILGMMEERRISKNDPQKYKNIQKAIRNKIREAKEKELEDRCTEIEFLQQKHDSYNLHRKVKELTGTCNRKQQGKLTDSDGNIIIDKQEKLKTWKEYLEKLFEDQRERHLQMEEPTNGPTILRQEVESAISQLKDGKAAGPDEINSEILKLFDEESVILLTEMLNTIYDSGKIPSEWLISEFIALPKKPGAKKCEEYRTISLMSHLLKLFLKIIHRRIYKLCESRISPNQFGFINAVGTREALFAIQVLFQRCRDVNCDLYICLIDYEKAFDRVKHDKMMEILKETGINDKDLRIIGNLYWNQTANLRTEGEHTENVKIMRGVRQGCVISPLIFNLYSERIFCEALDEMEKGILLNGLRLNNIRYADDTIVFAENLEDLQALMDNITYHSNQYGLNINVKKTKFMIISKNKITGSQLYINQTAIERVKQYTYLGTIINEDWQNSQEIKSRIGKAKSTFNRMSTFFKTHNLSLDIKVRLLRCYIFSVLLYGVESWTLNEDTIKKLNAFEMWLYRRILKIPWTARVRNEEVLRRMKKDLEIMNTIKVRKLQYLGHIMRNESRYTLLQSIMQGKIFGKRGPGRRRTSWLKNHGSIKQPPNFSGLQ